MKTDIDQIVRLRARARYVRIERGGTRAPHGARHHAAHPRRARNQGGERSAARDAGRRRAHGRGGGRIRLHRRASSPWKTWWRKLSARFTTSTSRIAISGRNPTAAYVISGSFDLGRLEDLLDFHPDDGTESTTVGGLVTEWLGHVPVVGEETERDGISDQSARLQQSARRPGEGCESGDKVVANSMFIHVH
jgi:hypothetical protein